ncbi:MAG: hypothetical protein RLZZ387_76 [Chloroflexota bacterium]|jgi:hypothetical protein
MKLFRGLSRTDYQDVLRALGHYIDEHGYTDVRLIEIEDGIVLQGRVPDRREIGVAGYDTFLITDEDLKEMVHDAFRRRGLKPPAYTE